MSETYHTYYENVYRENCENVHRCPICSEILSVLLKRCMNPQCSDYGVVL